MTVERSTLQCARSWEVEAVRDGRLRGHDAESLQRHLQTCSACQRERASLDTLQKGLGSLPRPRVDALAGRRVRQRVLMHHNAELLKHERASVPRRRASTRLAAAALFALAGGGAWHVSRMKVHPNALEAARQPPRVEVIASPGARWTRSNAPHDVRVTLDEGELKLTILRDSPQDRVLIVVPDGEVEDFGTVFRVAAANGATQSVHVERGSVVLRLRERAPLTLTAAQSWERETTERAPAPTAPASAALAPSRHVTPKTTARSADVPERSPETESSAAPAPSGSGPPSAPDANALRAEDDAYLHLVALVSEGRLDTARAAAKDYLLRFPNGFRRVEVLNIATRAP